jgi:hypothetical protein
MSGDVYVSTDVETDGPVPGLHSMLSFGSAAFGEDGRLLSTHAVNLHLLAGASGDAATMEWWHANASAWEATRRNCVPPDVAMRAYSTWLGTLPGRPLFVGYPAAFDFMFVQWYLVRFCGESPFGHSAIDIRSFAMGAMGVDYSATAKQRLPQRWLPESPHTHVALDDAIEQGRLFCNMLLERRDAPAPLRSPA